jgi:hypothetical protein
LDEDTDDLNYRYTSDPMTKEKQTQTNSTKRNEEKTRILPQREENENLRSSRENLRLRSRSQMPRTAGMKGGAAPRGRPFPLPRVQAAARQQKKVLY